MINPTSARESYGFRDATDKEDKITSAIISSNQCSKSELIVNILILLIILIAVAAISVYQFKYGFSMILTGICLCMSVIYVPKCYNTWKKYKNSSAIYINVRKKNMHFLLLHTVCVRKNPVEKNMYSLQARAADETLFNNIPVPKLTYDSIQKKDSLLIVIPDSLKEVQPIGIPYAYYKFINEPSKGYYNTIPDDDEKNSLTSEEIELIRQQYTNRTGILKKLYLKYILGALIIFILCTAAGFIFNMAVLIYPPLFAVVLTLGVIFMYFDDERQFNKHLSTPELLSYVKAYVQDNDTKTVKIKFASLKDNRILYTSRKKEDSMLFNKNDQCILLYYGSENPIPFKLCVSEHKAKCN